MYTFKEFLTEASTGQAKWDKYFGTADIETIAKSDSDLFDIFGKPTKKSIKKGDKLIVLAGDYMTKPKVLVNKGTYTMKFADIDKPFKVNQTVKGYLKPDQLGLFGPITIASYIKKVKKLLDDHHDVPEPQTEYLKALLDHAEDLGNEDLMDTVRDLYISSGVKEDAALKATINNDYMEVLGPLFVISEQPAYKAGGVRFPDAGNEPLYDFTMKFDGIIDSFSSKRSGGNTNTLKVTEVIKAIDESPDKAKLKRKYSKELELLNIIQNNSVKTAPNLINEWLAKTFPRYELLDASTDNTSIARLEAAVVKWITLNAGFDFVPMVQLAIPDLYYVKSALNSDGTLKVEPLKSGREISKAVLRSKSSPGHLSDKLGFAM